MIDNYTASDLLTRTNGYLDFALKHAKYASGEYDKAYERYVRERDGAKSFREVDELMKEMDYWRRSMSDAAHGLALARALLALGADRLDAWARARADVTAERNERGFRTGRDGDYRALLDVLGLYDVSMIDNGSIMAGICLLVDRAAGITTTNYAW